MQIDYAELIDRVPYIRLPSNFGPDMYEAIAKVARLPGSKIIDCTVLANVPMNLCEIFTSNWDAPSGAVPRLAIVTQIDAWSVVRIIANRAIAPLRERGCEMRLFYAAQLSPGHIHRWVSDGTEPPHELAATLEDLDGVWQGTAYASMVIDAVLELIRADTTPARAWYLKTLANVARKFAPDSLPAIEQEAAGHSSLAE